MVEESNIEKIIERLRSLDLSKYPKAEIMSLFEYLRGIPFIVTTLLPGRRIIRGRINRGDDFSLIQHHSYSPKEKNKKYQRASIPDETMFYGSVTSDESEEPVARVSILSEISQTVSGDAEKEEIMFSAWEVLEEINLISIVQCEYYQTPNKLIVEMEHRFNEEYQNESGRKFSEFMASEFAKKDTSHDYDYMISAIFSHFASKSADGIYYPSVRVDGAGMNVAIKPEAIDSKMRFLGAVNCEVTRVGKEIEVIEKTKSIFKLEYLPIDESDYLN